MGRPITQDNSIFLWKINISCSWVVILIAEQDKSIFKGIAPQKGATMLVNRNLKNNLKFKNICIFYVNIRVSFPILIAEKE